MTLSRQGGAGPALSEVHADKPATASSAADAKQHQIVGSGAPAQIGLEARLRVVYSRNRQCVVSELQAVPFSSSLLALLVILLLSSLMPLPSQVASATKAKQVLNIYNWAEYMPEAIIKGFEKEFNARVNYDTFSSNEEMLAKLQAGASGYDLIFPSDYMVQIMASLKLLQPLNKAHITNWGNLGKEWLNLYFDRGNKYSVPYLWGTLGIAYNSDKVKTPVTSWNDLWNSKFKGRIVLPNDSRELFGAILQSLGYSRNSTSKKELAEAKAKFKRLMPLVKAFDTDSPKTLFLSGEVWIGIVWSGEAALANRNNPAIKYVIPKEGGGIWMDNICIPKTAPHKSLAESFINYALRPEVGAQLSEAFPYGNPNAASYAKTSKKILANPASYPPKATLKKAEWLKDVGAFTQEYDRAWTEVKGQ